MTLTAQWTDSQDLNFQRKCEQAICKLATDIVSEASGGQNQPTVPEHAKRVVLANKVVNNPVAYGKIFAAVAVADGIVTAAGATDAAISNRCSAIWNTIAFDTVPS